LSLPPASTDEKSCDLPRSKAYRVNVGAFGLPARSLPFGETGSLEKQGFQWGFALGLMRLSLCFLQEFLRLILPASFFLLPPTAMLCRAHIRTASARTIARESGQSMIHHVGDQSTHGSYG
jgi:hypothetical protein